MTVEMSQEQAQLKEAARELLQIHKRFMPNDQTPNYRVAIALSNLIQGNDSAWHRLMDVVSEVEKEEGLN